MTVSLPLDRQGEDGGIAALPADRAGGLRPEPAAQSQPEALIPSAIVLINADDPDRKPQLYACPKCGSVHSPRIYMARDEVAHTAARTAAEDCYNCKTHNVCECGAECPKGWLACDSCRYAKLLDKAVEIPDDGGPYCAFDGDTYYTEMEQATDAGIEWVSPCEISYPKIDGGDVLDNLLGDMHEDASVDDLDGVDAFMEAVKAFNDAQRTQSWWGDSKRKIRVPAQGIEAATADETRSGSAVGESPVPVGDAPETDRPDHLSSIPREGERHG